MPAGVGTDLHDSEPSHPQLTKQRSNTMGQPEQNHIEITKASLQSRPRPSVKNPSGIHFLDLTLVLLNPDIPCLCKQCRSRSVGF